MTSKKQNFYHKATKHYDSLSLESQEKLMQCINEAESKYSEADMEKESFVNKVQSANFIIVACMSGIGIGIAALAGLFIDRMAAVGIAVLDAIYTRLLLTSVIPSEKDIIELFDDQLSDSYKNDVCGCVTKNPIDDMQIDYC